VQPLTGISVSATHSNPALETCIRHLTVLGAASDTGGQADIVLESEELELIGGGLIDSETTTQAALGLTDYIGPVDGRPARTGADVASSAAGFCGAAMTLACLLADYQRPIRVAISPPRALSALKTILWAARTRPDDWSGTHVRSREKQVDCGYATRTGRITLDFPVGAKASWHSFVEAIGLNGDVIERLEPRWYETVGWGDDVDEARSIYESALADFDRDQATALIRAHGGSSVPFLTPEECLAHPQSIAIRLPESLKSGLPWQLQAFDRTRPPGSPPRHAGRPLEGVRVVDLGVGGVGPFAATLLGWLGADVVKVEAPNEFILTVGPTVRSVSTTYLALNQGKRSVKLDLKNKEDISLGRTLISDADVVIENFRPGALDRLGFGFNDVAALNPNVIYCSVTGFGPTGPLAGEVCTDPHMQAFSGFASLNADPDEGLPRRVRYYGFVDLVTSCVAAEAICAALLVRRYRGGPLQVQTSMLQAVTEMLRASLEHDRSVLDGIFATQRGFIALTCRTQDEWTRLAQCIGAAGAVQAPMLRGLSDGLTDRPDVNSIAAKCLLRRPAAAWVHALQAIGIPAVRCVADEEVLGRTEFWHARLLQQLPVPHAPPLVGAGPPWAFEDAPESPPPAPLPGFNTEDLRRATHGFWRSVDR
jgi:crotonobetainyl-CoA:carnitine CoA-transferase CaiB-like acyl-CoA transferase